MPCALAISRPRRLPNKMQTLKGTKFKISDRRPFMWRRAHGRVDRLGQTFHIRVKRVRATRARAQHQRAQTELRQISQTGQRVIGRLRQGSHGCCNAIRKNVRVWLELGRAIGDRSKSRIDKSSDGNSWRDRRTCKTT